MKIARFAYNGQIHEAVYENEQLMVGSVAYDPDDVMWLPPIDPRRCTAIGVALGYADHAAELGLDLPEYPILFHKMPHSLPKINRSPRSELVFPCHLPSST